MRQLEWLRQLAGSIVGGSGGDMLTRDSVMEYWRWWPERIPHPPLSRELSGIGFLLSQGFLEPLSAYRVAVALTFAALVAFTGGFVLFASGSIVAGLAAGLTLVATPAVFAYGHLASTDMFLTAFWFGSVCCLEVHVRTGLARWLWASGLLVGAALATKFTGLLLGPVLIIWLAYRRRLDVKRLLTLALGAAGVFVAVNPVLWVAPVEGLSDYLGAGFARSQARLTQIRTYYFGEVYTYRPPWHYPFVWTAVVLPIPLWIAVAWALPDKRCRTLLVLCGVNLAVLYGALMLPGAPLHDGVRLFLPVFPFLAVLAGIGADRLCEFAGSRLIPRLHLSRHFVQTAVLIGLFALPIWRTIQYHPYQLSYFNGLIGGIRGAHSKGLEISNLKEALTPSTLSELARRIPKDARVNPGFFLEEMCFYRAFGYLTGTWSLEAPYRKSLRDEPRTLTCAGSDHPLPVELPRSPADPEFIFVLNRRGEWKLVEHALSRHGGDPYFQVTLEGVPLVQVYRTGG